MQRAWSRKNLWESTPAWVKSTLAVALRIAPHALLLGSSFRKHRRFVDDSQWWSKDRYADYQLDRLQNICALAYEKTPYYRRIFNECGFDARNLKSLESMRLLPTIDKHTVRDHLWDMCAVSVEDRRVDYIATGGSSGMPLQFYIGRERSAVEFAYLTASWKRVGYGLGMPMAVFRGRIVPPNKNGLRYDYNPILCHHYYSNFHMTDENIRRYLEHLATIGPCFLHVYPSSVFALARYLRRSGQRPLQNIRGIIAESETIYPEQRKMVEEVFGCRCFSCYGHTEKLVLAAECEHSTDYHVWPTYGYFELLDEQGRPVNTPGRRGEIVGTGFINRIVPFIRYRTGDYATYVGDHCPACGRQHILIRDIQGHRIQEKLVTCDGSEISWTALNMHDDTFTHVRQFQFYQDRPGQAVLRLVPAVGFSEQDARRIQHNLGRKLEGRLQFTIQLLEHIPLSPRGKAIYVDLRISDYQAVKRGAPEE